MARVPYVEPKAAQGRMGEMLAKMEAGGVQVLNLYRALAHAPEVGDAFIRMGNRILFKGLLPARARELAILLVGQLAQAPYEFSKHTDIGLECGMSAEEIAALGFWRTSSLFSEADRAVLAYTEEVSRGYRASDATFAEVRRHLDEGQTVELSIVIGYYEMVCRVLESLQVELEDEPFVTMGKTT